MQHPPNPFSTTIEQQLHIFLPNMMFFDSLFNFDSEISDVLISRDFTLSYLLDPILTIALEGGPIKTMPSSANRSANLAFSLKNPYL